MKYFSSTDFWDQYMINKLQFSCARNEAERLLCQVNVFDKDKVVRTVDQFLKFVKDEISGSIDEEILCTEYYLAVRTAVMVSRWKAIWKDRDLYPYMSYKCSNNPCEICGALDGLVMPIEDLIAQDIFPPNHFNCRCSVDQIDDESGVVSGKELIKYRDKISIQFQGNVGINGIFLKK